MIVREFDSTRDDGVNLYKTYSDQGYIIQKIRTEEYYDYSVDPEDKLEERQYVELDILIDDFFAPLPEDLEDNLDTIE